MAVEEQQGAEIDTGIPAVEKLDLSWLFNYDQLWLEFEAQMMGGKLHRKGETGNWYIKIPEGASPFMNTHGIKDVMATLRANVNVIGASSIYEEDRIRQWCRRFGHDLTSMLYNNQQKYELETSKFNVVHSTFMCNFESNLRKSLGGKALLYASQAERILETRTKDLTPNVPLMKRIF